METGHKKGHYFNKIPDDIISNHTRFTSFISHIKIQELIK